MCETAGTLLLIDGTESERRLTWYRNPRSRYFTAVRALQGRPFAAKDIHAWRPSPPQLSPPTFAHPGFLEHLSTSATSQTRASGVSRASHSNDRGCGRALLSQKMPKLRYTKRIEGREVSTRGASPHLRGERESARREGRRKPTGELTIAHIAPRIRDPAHRRPVLSSHQHGQRRPSPARATVRTMPNLRLADAPMSPVALYVMSAFSGWINSTAVYWIMPAIPNRIVIEWRTVRPWNALFSPRGEPPSVSECHCEAHLTEMEGQKLVVHPRTESMICTRPLFASRLMTGPPHASRRRICHNLKKCDVVAVGTRNVDHS